MNEMKRKINITKPRRSATYEVDGASGYRYKAVISKTGIALSSSRANGSYQSKIIIPPDDLEVVIDLLTEAQVEHDEQVKLEGDAA